MKIKLLCLLLTFTLCVTALCACTQEGKTSQDNGKYKLVEATQEDFDNIVPQLEPILAMCHWDYDCEQQNIYDRLFHINKLDENVCPDFDGAIAEQIAKPFRITDSFCVWDEYLPENDPLGKFEKIPDDVYDENGNVSEQLAFDITETTDRKVVIIGHNRFSADYIDFLVEEIWNGRIDHNSFFEFEDGTECYYNDGFYYTPERLYYRGGPGIIYDVYLNSITPLDNHKYRVEFVRYENNDIIDYHSSAVAVLGLKETKDGFRFWSIYELEQDK